MRRTARIREQIGAAARHAHRLRVRMPPDLVDAGVGLVVAAFLTGLTPVSRVYQAGAIPLDPLGYALLALSGLALALRRRWLHATYLVGDGSAVVYLALGFPGWPVYVGACLALVAYCSASGWSSWPLALAGGAALAIAAGRPEGWQPVRMATVFIAWLAIAAFTARAAELRRRRAEELARHRVVEERLRIARDLHDLLSHSLATISLQSGMGLRLLRTRPNEAELALGNIRRVSNEALAQARAALSAIRDPIPPADRAAPGLGDLESLFVSVRSTGLSLQTSVELGSEPVSPEIASAAYRIVQESLTNVMRHAGPAVRAAATISRQPDALVVEVTNTGGGAPMTPAPTTPGHGMAGMRERVLELGGEFSAGTGPCGGFRVCARLPPADRP